MKSARKALPLSLGWCHLGGPANCEHRQAQPHLTDLAAWGPVGREEGRGEQSRQRQKLCNQKGPSPSPALSGGTLLHRQVSLSSSGKWG